MAEWKRNVADDHKTLMHLLILFTTSENSSLQAGNCRSCDTCKRVWFSESIVVQAEGKRVNCDSYLFFKRKSCSNNKYSKQFFM